MFTTDALIMWATSASTGTPSSPETSFNPRAGSRTRTAVKSVVAPAV
jgi:hypothetical protein